MAIHTPIDLLAVNRESNLERLLRKRLAERVGEKPFEGIIRDLEKASPSPSPTASVSKPQSTTPTTTPTPTPMPTLTAGMGFDEAFSRLRMVLGALPSNQRRKLLPILVERMSKRVNPEDVEDFKMLGFGLLEEEEAKKDALERYLPILLILSMMRGS